MKIVVSWDLTNKNDDMMMILMGFVYIMWVKQCHKLPMTGNGKYTTYKHGDLGHGFMIVLTTLKG